MARGRAVPPILRTLDSPTEGRGPRRARREGLSARPGRGRSRLADGCPVRSRLARSLLRGNQQEARAAASRCAVCRSVLFRADPPVRADAEPARPTSGSGPIVPSGECRLGV